MLMRRTLPFLLTLLLCLGAAGCTGAPQDSNANAPADNSAETNDTGDTAGTSDDAQAETAFPYTFTDSTGAEVTLTAPPERVAVLFSSYGEIWTDAGGDIAITIGECVERGFAAEGTSLVDDGAGKSIDMELLLSYEPDFVIGSADIEAQAEACRTLQEAGVPAAAFQVETIDQYLDMLKICTDITGNTQAWETCGVAVKEQADAVLAAVEEYLAGGAETQNILFIRAGSQYSSTKAKTAKDNFVCVMLGELGAYNIADNAPVLLDGLSLEEILMEDPDYIFLTAMGSQEAAEAYIDDLFAQDGWRQLTAVAEGNYQFLPREMFHFKPNARWGEAYAYLAQLLYPDLTLS